MSDYVYCRKCGHNKLEVGITDATATIEFDSDIEDGQLQSVNGYAWGPYCEAECANCGHEGLLRDFEHSSPFQAVQKTPWRLLRADEPITVGVMVITLCGETDMDENDDDRFTPPMSVGSINDHNNQDVFDLVFPNGAWVCPTESELRDPAQYALYTKA